jgi:hypothetical protein
LTHRFGTFASLRVAIPLGAALIVAIVLPAVLLRDRDSTIPPFAAPVASESQVVHTQAVPKARKRPAAPHRARHAAPAVQRSIPVFIPVTRSVPRGGAGIAAPEHVSAPHHDVTTRAQHASAKQANAKREKAKHANARSSHAKKHPKPAKTQPAPAIVQPTPAELTPVNAQPTPSEARAEHPDRASHTKDEKAHGAATPDEPVHPTEARAHKTQPPGQGQARGHDHGQGHGRGQDQPQDEDQNENQVQPHGKGKP